MTWQWSRVILQRLRSPGVRDAFSCGIWHILLWFNEVWHVSLNHNRVCPITYENASCMYGNGQSWVDASVFYVFAIYTAYCHHSLSYPYQVKHSPLTHLPQPTHYYYKHTAPPLTYQVAHGDSVVVAASGFDVYYLQWCNLSIRLLPGKTSPTHTPTPTPYIISTNILHPLWLTWWSMVILWWLLHLVWYVCYLHKCNLSITPYQLIPPAPTHTLPQSHTLYLQKHCTPFDLPGGGPGWFCGGCCIWLGWVCCCCCNCCIYCW